MAAAAAVALHLGAIGGFVWLAAPQSQKAPGPASVLVRLSPPPGDRSQETDASPDRRLDELQATLSDARRPDRSPEASSSDPTDSARAPSLGKGTSEQSASGEDGVSDPYARVAFDRRSIAASGAAPDLARRIEACLSPTAVGPVVIELKLSAGGALAVPPRVVRRDMRRPTGTARAAADEVLRAAGRCAPYAGVAPGAYVVEVGRSAY